MAAFSGCKQKSLGPQATRLTRSNRNAHSGLVGLQLMPILLFSYLYLFGIRSASPFLPSRDDEQKQVCNAPSPSLTAISPAQTLGPHAPSFPFAAHAPSQSSDKVHRTASIFPLSTLPSPSSSQPLNDASSPSPRCNKSPQPIHSSTSNPAAHPAARLRKTSF